MRYRILKRAASKAVRALALLPLVGCAATQARPRAAVVADLPAFSGEETERWLVEESGPVGRDDVLPAFEAAAKDYGCSTETLGGTTSATIQGQRLSYYGVSASCYEGTIALITLVGGSVRIGCAKPTTTQACERLLHDISGSP